jgi:hypothetical protein
MAVMTLASCTAAPTPGLDPFLALRREPGWPAVGQNCPRSAGQSVLPDTGPGLGPGPVWPIGFGIDGLQSLGKRGDDGSYAVKVLWGADKTYLGPVLIRGIDLETSMNLKFSLAGGAVRDAVGELQLPAATQAAERTWPSTVYVQKGGCFAFRIDGASFGNIIVVALVAEPDGP